MSPNLLAQGYAVASNSLNAAEQNCNDLVAAEAFAMTREHFIETHGEPAFTMGIGCSGGAAQAYQIADNYPGLLDGLVVGCSLADLGFDVGQLVFDARLLQQYAQRFPGRLSADQLAAVSGLPSVAALSGDERLARGSSTRWPDSTRAVPAAARYDPREQRRRRAGHRSGTSTAMCTALRVAEARPDDRSATSASSTA